MKAQKIILIDELTDDNKLWLLPMIEEVIGGFAISARMMTLRNGSDWGGASCQRQVAEKENPFAVTGKPKS